MSEKLKIDTSDPATRATWEAAKAAKREVEAWPAWKRGEPAPPATMAGTGEVAVDASLAVAVPDACPEPDEDTQRAALGAEVRRLWNIEAERDQLLAYVDDAKRAAGDEQVSGEPLAETIARLRAETDRLERELAQERTDSDRAALKQIATLKRWQARARKAEELTEERGIVKRRPARKRGGR